MRAELRVARDGNPFLRQTASVGDVVGTIEIADKHEGITNARQIAEAIYGGWLVETEAAVPAVAEPEAEPESGSGPVEAESE